MKYFIFFIGFLFLAPFAGAQVTVTDDPDYDTTDASALFEVKGTSGGFLLPRMTTQEQRVIQNPAEGLVIFNTDSADLYCYDGSVWKALWDYPTDTITVLICPDSIEYSGQWYTTVPIGNHCWMAENLNYETGNSWCYNNNSSNCAIYGRLYDWSTALNTCPSGWHMPSDEDWCALTTYIDPTVDCDEVGFSGTDAGYKMKSTSGWYNNGNGSDAFGFAALPGGYYLPSPSFYGLSEWGEWWSFTEFNSSDAWGRRLYYNLDDVSRYYFDKTTGRSVRCLKDD